MFRSRSWLTGSWLGVAAVLLLAASAAAQLPEERRAYDAIDQAITAFNRATDRASRLRAAEGILTAAQAAETAFGTADNRRDTARDRMDLDCCHASAPCSRSDLINCAAPRFHYGEAVLPARDLAAVREALAWLRNPRNAHGTWNGTARQRAAGSDTIGRALTAHFAANQAAREAIGRAGSAIAAAARRLTDASRPGTGLRELTTTAGALDLAVSNVVGVRPGVSLPVPGSGGSRAGRHNAGLRVQAYWALVPEREETLRTIGVVVFAARETMAALKDHLEQVAARAPPREPVGETPLAPTQGAAGQAPSASPTVESQPPTSFAGWVRQVNAAVAEVEEWADAAVRAASGSGNLFVRSRECRAANNRRFQADLRVNRLLNRRSAFLPADADDRDAIEEVRRRLSEARSRAGRACASIHDRG